MSKTQREKDTGYKFLTHIHNSSWASGKYVVPIISLSETPFHSSLIAVLLDSENQLLVMKELYAHCYTISAKFLPKFLFVFLNKLIKRNSFHCHVGLKSIGFKTPK